MYSMGWDSVLNNLPYGERFRKHRKWLQDALSPRPHSLKGGRSCRNVYVLTMANSTAEIPNVAAL